MNINPIAPGLVTPQLPPIDRSIGGGDVGVDSNPETFSQFLTRSIDSVNEQLQAADKATTDLAVGKSENLHEAMISVEKAETAFKLLAQVRSKALEAYHEVMRMQV